VATKWNQRQEFKRGLRDYGVDLEEIVLKVKIWFLAKKITNW